MREQLSREAGGVFTNEVFEAIDVARRVTRARIEEVLDIYAHIWSELKTTWSSDDPPLANQIRQIAIRFIEKTRRDIQRERIREEKYRNRSRLRSKEKSCQIPAIEIVISHEFDEIITKLKLDRPDLDVQLLLESSGYNGDRVSMDKLAEDRGITPRAARMRKRKCIDAIKTRHAGIS